MTQQEFEELLNIAVQRLTDDVRNSKTYHKPQQFEDRVREVIQLEVQAKGQGKSIDPKAQAFPDVVFEQYGVEVKATENDSWRCIANSVSEGTRNLNVKHVYVIYGKMGGTPQVKWSTYEDAIIHVRTSHVPRFEIEIGSERQSLFKQMGLSYEEFRVKDMHGKMDHIRAYARSRLNPGERLWWLEDKPEDEQQHSLPIAVQVYMELSQKEKRQMRAEAALMCPQIVAGSRARRKYVDAVMYLMTYRGVLCPQARDLFSAGSVALRADNTRGGSYLIRSLTDIQHEMRVAASSLEDALFVEYWGENVAPKDRILKWLALADEYAEGLKPSDYLFLAEQGKIG